MADKLPVSRSSLQSIEERKPAPSYGGLYRFCTKRDLVILLPAIATSIVSGLLIPAFTILFGRIFDSFASFSSGDISSNELRTQVTQSVLGVIGIGGAAWALGWCHMALWLAFGENIAKHAREAIMTGLMEKSMTWYDGKTVDNGVSGYINKAVKY
jgi:ATP-binding cassette, subfamily B (MDR/TAP), member 1